MGLSDSYSGIVLNQNASSSGTYPWRDTYNGNWIYQTLTLPADYERGTTEAEQIIPDISGLQVLVSIGASYAPTASLDYVFQVYEGDDAGWNTLTSGTVIGAHADGQYVWFDAIFPESVPIPPTLLTKEFRFGLYTRTAQEAAFNQPVTTAVNGSYLIGTQGYSATLTNNVPYPITVSGLPAFLLMQDGSVSYSVQQGISNALYVSPTPLQSTSTGLGQAYQSDGITPLLGHGTTACLNFRLLGLVADSGTDFLGNEYRSAVIQSAAGNTSTTRGLTPVSGSGQAPFYMSPPQPSPYSVVSLYFDMRPVPSTPEFGAINMIANPSFEYDAPGLAPRWWTVNAGSDSLTATVRSTTVTGANQAAWTASGVQSCYLQGSVSTINQQVALQTPLTAISPTTGGNPTPLAASMSYDITSATNARLYFAALFYDSNQTYLSTFTVGTTLSGAVGTGQFSNTLTVPANAAYVAFEIPIYATAASASMNAYVDAVQVTQTTAVLPYFDGDQIGSQWTAQRGDSPSVQMIDPEVQDDTVVLDGVLIDPITPNMALNVYYSNDDTNQSNNMLESDWEGKLWTRIPKVYLATQRQQYVFPQPINCKYAKIEFTNLPAQSYDPGPFQKPVSYKKFPTWVANYFLSQLKIPPFTSGQVNVVYDALQFAYDYYLDDLNQAPATPSAPPTDITSQLTSYFNTTPAGADATTLAQVNLAMQPYQQAVTANVNTNTVLGSYVASTLSTLPSATENSNLPVLDYSTVSSLSREPMVLEQSLPVMFFFVTCRHGYKELTASFDYNRAYFAGVNDIAFLRSDYTVASDTSQYIETGGDQAHIQSSDWVLDTDGNWYVYGA